MNTRIIINFQFEALHSWPECNLPGLEYLRTPHRHVFHVEMKKEVNHDDRDIEFINFKSAVLRWVRENWEGKYLEGKSCEMMARHLLKLFDCSYVKVMEDGENGAEVEGLGSHIPRCPYTRRGTVPGNQEESGDNYRVTPHGALSSKTRNTGAGVFG